MDGPFLREVATLPTLPIALAAHENQLAIIMPPTGIPLTSSVYSLTTNRNPATGSFYYQPYGRFDVLPSIESAAKEVEQQRVQMMMKQRRTFIGQVLRSLRVAAKPSHRPS